MKLKIRGVSTWRAALLAVALPLGWGSVHAQQIKSTQIYAKGILHEDGTRTDSIKDVQKRETSEITYSANGVVIAKKVFLLNENGDPLQGIIYDGAGNLIARAQFFFDDLGRVTEERCINPKGEIFRRVIRQYDASGKALPSKAFDFAVNAPNMKPATMDFTKMLPGTGQESGAPSSQPKQPGQKPQIQTASPRNTSKPISGAGKK